MATHPSVPSHVTSEHCSGGGLSPVGGSRWPCEDGGPLAPCPSPKASAMCCGSPSPRKPLPVPGAQRDRSKWGLWTEQGRGPLATRGHTPGGARRTGCPHKLPPSEAALWDRRRAPRVGSSRHRRGWTAGRRQGRGLLSPAALPSPSRQVFVVELLGRRLLILLGFSICFTACCVLTAALALQVRRGGTEEDRAPPTPFAHCPLSADLPVASGGIACWRRSQAPPSLTRQSGWPLGTEVPDGPWPRPPPLCGASFDCSLPAGLSIVDALPQHRVRHLLRHRTRPWAQYVPGAASALALPPVLHHRLELPREARGGAAPSLTGVWAEHT